MLTASQHMSKKQLVAIYIFISFGVILCLFPLYWMMLSSMRTLRDIYVQPPMLLPIHLNFSNYQELLRTTGFTRSIINSLFIALSVTMLNLLFCSMGGFGFAKYSFKGKYLLFRLLLITMMIPWVNTIIPSFIMISRIGLIDKYFALILPSMVSAWGIFLMRQYILSIPDELLDAARIDGCSEYHIYAMIVVPLTKPAFVTVGIFCFLGSWNNFLWPLLVLRSNSKLTFPLMLSVLATSQWIEPYHLISAGCFLATIPIILIFFAMQRHFITGFTQGAIR